jgi:hypothetical protein
MSKLMVVECKKEVAIDIPPEAYAIGKGDTH